MVVVVVGVCPQFLEINFESFFSLQFLEKISKIFSSHQFLKINFENFFRNWGVQKVFEINLASAHRKNFEIFCVGVPGKNFEIFLDPSS